MTRIILHRILGNDLPPRHTQGQTLANVAFILEHEPPLAGCERRWLLNRIADPQAEAALVALLERHGQRYLRMPFVEADYFACGIDFRGLPETLYLHRAGFHAQRPLIQLRIREWCFRARNLYLMNNNGARNAALRDGRADADWVMPFDGNCFFTAAAWEEVLAALGRAGAARYLVIPMARILENRRLLEPGYRPEAREEPQVAFRRDADAEFDERLRYGAMPKASFLYRLGVPGPWQEYGPRNPGWEAFDFSPLPEAGQFAQGGWVARLFSGQESAEKSDLDRFSLRLQSILALCRAVDARIARRLLPPARLCFFEETALAAEREAWRRSEPALVDCIVGLEEAAENALGFAAAPQRIERLPAVLDNLAILGLAWYFTGEERFARHAAALARAWLVAPATRVEPRADGNPGIARVAGLAYALDGARLAERAGALAPQEAAEVRAWCRRLLAWFRKSETAREAALNENAIGTAHDLAVASLALYSGELAFAREHLHAARMRIATRVPAANAAQERVDLNLWAGMARLAASAGVDLRQPLARLLPPQPAQRYRQPPRPGYSAAPFWMLGIP
jgi:hypothetical protein